MPPLPRLAAHRSTQISLAVAGAVAVLLVCALPLSAQDTRTVEEPTLPSVCVTLQAAFTPTAATSGEIEILASKSGSSQTALDTPRLQQALDHCDRGKAVQLAVSGDSTAFLTGPLALPAGVTLLLDKGVTLYGTRNPEFYAFTPGSCGVVNDDSAAGCKPLISVRDATGAAIMGDGSIDGQGGTAMIIDGKPSTMTWWDLAEDARNAGQEHVPRMIDTDLSDNLTLYRVTLKNAPGIHIAFHRGDGLTVWGVKIDTPRSARNTDGIDAAQSRNITITRSFLRSGADDIAIKAGDGPTTNASILHNHLYWGHGLSIGNETTGGVSGIRVQDVSLDGPDNGLRIHSSATHGGAVEDVVYDDICIRNSKNPILFDSAYSFPGKGAIQLPVYRDITLHNVRLSGGGKVEFDGFDSDHRIAVTLDGVVALDSAARYRAQANHTDITFGAEPVNLVFIGDDATVTNRQVHTGILSGCAAQLIPFPVAP